MSTKISQVLPINEANELVIKRGVGTNSVTGFIPTNQSPTDDTDNKMVVKLPPEVAITKMDGSNNPIGVVGTNYLDKVYLKIARAISGAERNNRMVLAPWGPAPTWTPSTVYTAGMKVRGTGADAANLYMCVGTTTQIGDATQPTARTGTSASSGNGPTGTGIQGTAGSANVAFSTVTRVGTTATFKTVGGKAHGMGVGYQFNASGITPSGFNGTWVVSTVPAADTFTATISADPGSDATVPGSYIQYNTIVDGTVVWTYYGKATSTGTTPLYSTVTPTTAADVMNGFVSIIAAANYTALGLVPTVTSAANPKFRVSGVLPATWGTFSGAPAGPIGSFTRPTYYTRPVIEVSTNSDTWIAIEPQAQITQYLQIISIEVNDRLLSESSYVSTVATAKNAYLLNLAPFGPGVKRIKISYKGANATNGANLAYSVAVPADTFAYPTTHANPIRFYLEGDSITQTIGLTGQIDPANHVEGMMSSMLGFSDAYNGAVGGTGAVATGGNTTYGQRIPDVVSYAPDIIYVGGFHNDNPATGVPNLPNQAAFLAYFQALRAAAPYAPIIVSPYHMLRNESLVNATATENDVKAAFNAWGDSNALFIPNLTAPSPMENTSPGKFFVNVTPYTDTHPWVLFQLHRVAYEVAAIKNWIASKVS